MADILRIKRELAARAQAVAEMLLPGGRKDGSEWRAGSTGGEKGESLGVHLTGQKAGIWSDFATGEGGDLLDLWCACRGMQLPDAIEAARMYLGIERQEPFREPRKTYVRPDKPKCSSPRAHVMDYLCEERAIPGEVLERYKVGENGRDIMFPFLLPDGTLAMYKTRTAEASAHPRPVVRDCEPVLFGWQAIPTNARELVITEGEIDALSMAAYGWPAVSVPFGGGGGAKQQWIENEYDRLERFERIYIATDMDKEGDAAAAEIVSRLGRHRCLRVKLPHKDANECLVAGVTKDAMAGIIAKAESLDPEGLRRPSDYLGEVMHLFWPANEERVGYRTPYGKLGDKLLFRPAEVTLWSGASGAGKSQVLSDCIVDWVKQGSRTCLVSLEMKGNQTLKRMCKQASGLDRPSQRLMPVVLDWLDQGLLLWERVGKAGIDALLEIFDYARAKYGCDQFVIDSLMRLGIAGDDYTGQEQAVFRLVDWAVDNNVHLHLVAHARKGDRDRGVPDTEDIKGAMEIGANAFNIVTVWRNRKREEAVQEAKTDVDRRDAEAKPSAILNVAKQRNGDFEGKVALWFDMETYRYRSAEDNAVWGRRYVSLGDKPELEQIA